MTLSGILSSRSQRRSFLLATILLLFLSGAGAIGIAIYLPPTPLWNVLNSLLVGLVGSGAFAVLAALYIQYFFEDPTDLEASSALLPKDIGEELRTIVERAADYRIFVRTGRHFRAETLPLLVKKARDARQPIRLEVVLLDPRDGNICERYAEYRARSSFDRQRWSKEYVQTEIIATVLAIADASQANRGLVSVDLFLSKRLSIFRIEGSSDELLVTREDPKDTASRYMRSHPDFPAFLMEFSWIRDEAFRVGKDEAGILPGTLHGLLGASYPALEALERSARAEIQSPSPYAR